MARDAVEETKAKAALRKGMHCQKFGVLKLIKGLRKEKSYKDVTRLGPQITQIFILCLHFNE